MRLSRASAAALEWPTFLKLLAPEAVTDAGRQRILSLSPLDDGAEIEERIARGVEIEALLVEGAVLPVGESEFLPVFELLRKRPHELEGPDLLAVRSLLRLTRSAAERIDAAGESCQTLGALAAALPRLDELRHRLEKTLDSRGRVRDDASPRLAELRRRAQQVRQRIYDRLEDYSRAHREELAEDTVTLHDERLVVLLRSGAHKPAGLVHGRSGSGQSVYFEPLDVVAENNDLKEVHGEEAEERERLMRELVASCCAELPELEEHLEFAAVLDERQAAARWAKLVAGAWIAPRESGRCRLLGARHPFLDPRLAERRRSALGSAGHPGDVVPLELELDSSLRVLVVTGPNAGGKTVVLKTLGLLSVAAHCGLPVPMEPDSELPLLRELVAIVGDEQDLLADQSTFSGRLLRFKEAWEQAGSNVLVLLDELGAGTDPEEGAALGIAFIEGLLERESWAVVSSHLLRVASAALELDGAGCAAMAFDGETGAPAYRLLPGTPGSSEALALARRLGLPSSWLRRAEALLGPEHGRLQVLLAEVEAARSEIVRSAAVAAAEARQVAAERELLESEVARLEEERRRSAEKARTAVESFRAEVRERLRAEVEKLEEAFAAGRRRGLASAAEAEMFRDAPFAAAQSMGGPVTVGENVRHRTLGWEGKLVELRRGRAEVVVTGKRVQCRAGELEPVSAGPRPEPMPAVSLTRRGGASPDPDIDLRGERVEPALERLERFIDRALVESLSEVRIVHGHGSGSLKRAVREWMENHPSIARWRPGGAREGGDGATIAELGQ